MCFHIVIYFVLLYQLPDDDDESGGPSPSVGSRLDLRRLACGASRLLTGAPFSDDRELAERRELRPPHPQAAMRVRGDDDDD